MTQQNYKRKVSMRDMFEAGVHFGHKIRYWSPKMEPYIYGKKGGSHIINLEYSLPMFYEVMNFVSKIAATGEQILFVGTKAAAREAIEKYAISCCQPYVNNRWLGGMLTNFKTIKKSLTHLEELESLMTSKRINQYSKKQRLFMEREFEKSNKNLAGIRKLKFKPAAIFVIDIGHESIAVKEAKKLNIPVIAIIDTNHNPDEVDLMVPGNDDSHKAINLYLSAISDCINDARQVAGLNSENESKKGLTKKDVIKQAKVNLTEQSKTEVKTEVKVEVKNKIKDGEKEKTSNKNKEVAKPTKKTITSSQ